MALDEYLFGRIVRYLKHKQRPASVQHRHVTLEMVKTRLLLLARAITGSPVEIFPAVKEGGFKGDSFFLPDRMDYYSSREMNHHYYMFRTLYLCSQYSLQQNWYKQEPLSDTAALQLATAYAPEVLAHLFLEFPVASDIHDQLQQSENTATHTPVPLSWLYGKWMKDHKQAATDTKLSTPEGQRKQTTNLTPKTTIKARAVEEIIRLETDLRQQEDYVLTHNFEKVDTADEFSGSWRDFDGEDELKDHCDALDELSMKFTVRTDDPTHSIYEASYTDDAQVAESTEGDTGSYYICYDEWNCHKNAYRKDYSKVYPHRCTEADTAYYDRTIHEHTAVLNSLRRMLTSINNKWVQQRLQLQGKEIDMDMATDRFTDIFSGQAPTERVYISDRKQEKDLSILLLLDISLSSDSYAAGNRVIDVAKQTAILFGEILAAYHVDFSVHCFYSRTRNYLAYTTLKTFDDGWHPAKYRIGSLTPAGYTRIGPALRHSGSLLYPRMAKNKWILLLSDGKPNDYDRYEGKYGVGDVRQALKELRQQHIHTYALAIEADARYYLPRMFGQDHYQIVSSPGALLHTLVKLYERIRYGG